MCQLFFALSPDELVRHQIATINCQQANAGIRYLPRDLYAKLIGLPMQGEEQIASICQAATQIRAEKFSLQLDAREWWKESGLSCISASQIPAPLNELISNLKQLMEPFGYEREKSDYRLLIPLMREVEKPLRPITFKAIPWLVHDFCLLLEQSSDSEDPYKVIQRWDFM